MAPAPVTTYGTAIVGTMGTGTAAASLGVHEVLCAALQASVAEKYTHKGVLWISTSVGYLFGSCSKGQAPSALLKPVPAERLGVQAKHGLNNESAGFDANLQLLAKKCCRCWLMPFE